MCAFVCVNNIAKTKHKRITLRAWNVRTLLNRIITSRPERGTAFVSRELQHYRVDIAALSETRIADESSLREERGDYTFFWKRKPQAETGFTVLDLPSEQLCWGACLCYQLESTSVSWNSASLSAGSDTSQLSALTPLHLQAQMMPRNNFMNSLTKSSGQPHRTTN